MTNENTVYIHCLELVFSFDYHNTISTSIFSAISPSTAKSKLQKLKPEDKTVAKLLNPTDLSLQGFKNKMV